MNLDQVTSNELGSKTLTQLRDIAKEIGKTLASRAKDKNIDEVVFDRNGYIYHGKVKSLADGAREAGLKF